MKRRCIRVAVALPIRKTFSYIIPEDLPDKDYTGYGVLVPFGNQKAVGFVLGEEMGWQGEVELKKIIDIINPKPFFTKKMVRFFEWLSEYYFYPIGEVIQNAIPSGLNISRFFTATITKKGQKAIDELPEGSKERDLLIWIRENPRERLNIPLRIIHELQEKGWIKAKREIRRKEKGPLMRKFARIKASLDTYRLKELSKEEQKLLSLLNTKGDKPVCELSRYIKKKDIYYLVRRLEKKGIIESFDAPVYKDISGEIIAPIIIPERLEKQQEQALSEISGSLKGGGFSVHLIFGVTGSGKTEVYFRAAQMAMDMGRQVIIILPEISLANYIESLFRARLGDRVAIYHSRLSPGERYDQWMRMVKGEVDVVIGARSALFSPLPRLGLIIVDEEHDPSYKQEAIPYYQARDSAVVRAQIEDATVLLGSGTPSVQSYYNCLVGKYSLIRMPERIDNRPLPEMEVVDMRYESPGSIFSQRLISAIREDLEAKNQCILFLNKRGFYRLYMCRRCGRPVRCPNCEVSLVYHMKEKRLRCHYCGYHRERPERCSSCGARVFRTVGFGTERVERELAGLLPEARIARMDADSIRRKGRASHILKRFMDHELDILIGTQMVTKGYHFPLVTLVGVIYADMSLLFPDFRAAEWTYQLLSQVAGRAGRGRQRGRVIIQTFNPDHYSIQAAVRHNYAMFFNEEKELRSSLKYPPFSHLMCLRFQGNVRQNTMDSAYQIAKRINRIVNRASFKDEIQVLGPIEAPIPKIKGKYRYQIIIKSKRPRLQSYILQEIESVSDKMLKPKGVSLVWDVDPYYML